MTHPLEDDLFHLLPVPALRWPAHAPTHACPNHAYTRAFHPAGLPAPVTTWADGTHHTRLLTPSGDRHVCRLHLSTLPNTDRLLLIEDVHTYHLDPVTQLPTRDALLGDAAQTHGVTTLAALRLPTLRDHRQHLGDAPVDRALRHIARDLEQAAQRWSASAYHVGPHEFVLLSPHPLTPAGLAPLLRRAAQHLSALGRQPDICTGLADAPHDGRTLADLLAAAHDRAGTPSQPRGPLGLLRRLLRPAPTRHASLAL